MHRARLRARAEPLINNQTIAGRILLALRAGETDGDALNERFRNPFYVLNSLTRFGLITSTGRQPVTYRITPAGRKACPSRRDPAPAPTKRKGV